MKEVHIGPMAVEGNFHTGKIMEVVSADVYTRWQLFTNPTLDISVVHDSWNTYGSENNRHVFKQREELITSYKLAKSSLRLLPSADLQLEKGVLNILSPQEFRDDDPENAVIVNGALRQLKRNGLLIPGIIEGQKGLYLDVDKVIERDSMKDTIDSTQIFPITYHTVFRRSLDKNNQSSYMGKLPITKYRTFGLPVDPDLLESDNYYEDQRFSPDKSTNDSSNQEKKICVVPLVLSGLLPYIRDQKRSDKVEVDFISNGTASSVRFNLVSMLLNRSLGLDIPYKNIHLFGRLNVDEVTGPAVLASKDWAMKVRYMIFDQLPANPKTISNNYAYIDPETSKLEIPEFTSFAKKLFYLQRESNYEQQDGFPELTSEELSYLKDIGITDAMKELNYSKAFRKLKSELAKRSKQVIQGVSPNDKVLLRTINLFMPELYSRSIQP